MLVVILILINIKIGQCDLYDDLLKNYKVNEDPNQNGNLYFFAPNIPYN